jgi:hypothetical protein
MLFIDDVVQLLVLLKKLDILLPERTDLPRIFVVLIPQGAGEDAE